MMIQPSWGHVGPAAYLILKLAEKGVEYKGPGIYKTDTQTFIIVSANEDPWSTDYDFYLLFCWNAPFEKTVLHLATEAPVYDSRNKDA